MRSYLKLIFLLAFSSNLILSCTKESDCAGQEPDAVLGIWEYESGELGEKEEIRSLPRLIFYRDSTFSCSNSANQISGVYQTDMENGINLDIKGSTYAAEWPWAAAFTKALGDAEHFCTDGQTLQLQSNTSGHTLVFRKLDDLPVCRPVQQNQGLFQDATSDSFQWRSFNLDGTCLEVQISYGGGCGDSPMQLIVGEDLGESDPPVIGAKLLFTDNELCEALVTKSYYFDLSSIRAKGVDLLWLNFIELDEMVLVSY